MMRRAAAHLSWAEYARLYNEVGVQALCGGQEDYVELDYFDTISHEAYLDRVRSEVEEGYLAAAAWTGAAMPPWRVLSRRFMETNRATTLLAMIKLCVVQAVCTALRRQDRLPECYASYLDSAFVALPPAVPHVVGDPTVYFNVRTGGSRRSKIYSPVIETLLYMDEHGIRMLSESDRAAIDVYNDGVEALGSGRMSADALPDSFRAAVDSLNALWSGEAVQAFVKEKGDKFIEEIVDVRMAICDRWRRLRRAAWTGVLRSCCAANIHGGHLLPQHSMGSFGFLCDGEACRRSRIAPLYRGRERSILR